MISRTQLSPTMLSIYISEPFISANDSGFIILTHLIDWA
jgi:hypothetical protein